MDPNAMLGTFRVLRAWLVDLDLTPPHHHLQGLSLKSSRRS
jgi:hypothetical protein